MSDALAVLLLFVGLAISALSLPILIKPRWLRLDHRIYALPAALTFFGCCGLVMFLFPHFGDPHGKVSDNRIAGVVLLILWGTITLLARAIARRSRAKRRQEASAEPVATPISKGIWSKLKADLAKKWAESGERQRQKEEERAARRRANAEEKATRQRQKDEEQAARQIAEAEEDARKMKLYMEEAMGADGRLEKQFERLRNGEIDLDDYRDVIAGEEDRLRDKVTKIREERPIFGEEYYELQMDGIEEDRDAIRWRKQWVDDQRYKEKYRATADQKNTDGEEWLDHDAHRARISRPGFAEAGRSARFEYVDRDGVVTERRISNWERRGGYIVGWCNDRREERTFRQDRIDAWQAE